MKQDYLAVDVEDEIEEKVHEEVKKKPAKPKEAHKKNAAELSKNTVRVDR